MTVSPVSYDRSQPWAKRIFSARNIVIFALMAGAFAALNRYRFNDPLPPGLLMENFYLTAQNGETFDISQIRTPKVLVFYGDGGILSNRSFALHYKRLIPQLKFLQDKNLAQIVVITKGCDTPEEVKNFASKTDTGILKELGYAADTSAVAKRFGVRSWPHLFVISGDGRVLYEAKLATADHIKNILWRD